MLRQRFVTQRQRQHLKMKLCIIGAGKAGICAAKTAMEFNIEPVVFEQTADIGGTWVYRDATDKDEYGLDVHSSMYEGLRTNLPKEIMGYPDFKIDTDDGTKSYIKSTEIRAFLQKYAEHFNVTKYIKFLHHVMRVHPVDDKWEVTTKDLKTNKISVDIFDNILICNGHYHTPMYPNNISGLDTFQGKLLHSHSYRNTDLFKDETVLIIGAGPSGMDLCHEISKVAKMVTLSHNFSDLPKTKFLDNVNQKPGVRSVYATGVIFGDGTRADYTLIFFCTGYKYTFPFLTAECGIFVEENHVQPLFKHCLNIARPSMGIVGIPYYVCAATMMHIQSKFLLKYFLGQIEIPSKQEMLADSQRDMNERLKKGYKKKQAHMLGEVQDTYYKEITRLAKIPDIDPVMAKLHNESSQRFMDDMTNFRNDVFAIIDKETFIKIN